MRGWWGEQEVSARWAGDEREVSSSWSSRTSPLHHTPPPSSNAQPLKTWPWSLQSNMLKKILPKVQQTQMAAGENWKKWSNFKRPEDPLNLVQIKNPFGSFLYNPQAYAWWVLPFFQWKSWILKHPIEHSADSPQCLLFHFLLRRLRIHLQKHRLFSEGVKLGWTLCLRLQLSFVSAQNCGMRWENIVG